MVYSLYTNGRQVGAAGTPSILAVLNPLPANSVVTLNLRVRLTNTLADGSTNLFQFYVDDQAPGAGDGWPTGAVLAPSLDDTGNARDYQNVFSVARVSGPIIRISKSVNLTSARPYDLLTYTIHYTNAGSAAAFGVTVRDTVPIHTTNAAGFSNAHNGGAWAANGALAGNKVVFTPGGGTLNTGDRGDLKFTVQVR
jgi:uncharacterized repeat protein (TIGR01451 family)